MKRCIRHFTKWQIHPFISKETNVSQSIGRRCHLNPYSAEILLSKLWRPKSLFQFEIIINVSVSSVRFIWILMLWVHAHYILFIFSVRGSTLDDRFWRLETVAALKGLIYNVTLPDNRLIAGAHTWRVRAFSGPRSPHSLRDYSGLGFLPGSGGGEPGLAS